MLSRLPENERHVPAADATSREACVLCVHSFWYSFCALHQPGSGIRIAADRLLAQIGLGETLQANELPSNMILSLLRMGDHLAIVPRYVLATTSLAGELVQIDSGEAQVSLSHAAVWTDRSATPAVGRFVEHMCHALNRLGEI